MGDESEKRFQAAMDKLFQATPKSKPNTGNTGTYGVQSMRGKKRMISSSPFAKGNMGEELQNSASGSAESAQAPRCRPWDRGDLLRRLATFKSMTWFARPQVVSPVNCARRGWINVDVDTIACESCGARLLFSTPSAWAQQQVEKAAMVFSLKLETGHKLLCPWLNNSCTEELAQFPPTPRDLLVEDYKKRCSSLSKLLALPEISPVAVDNMRSPQLEQFLREFSSAECDVSADASGTEHLGNKPDSVSSISYYQAQKLLSLCGWEPHILPYIVDCKGGQNQSIKEANFATSDGQNQITSVYSLCTNDNVKANEEGEAAGNLQLDPNSVVLDCKLCGASVGLWAFSTVPRPVEYLTLVGSTEVNGRNHSADEESSEPGSSLGSEINTESREGVINTATTVSTSLNQRSKNFSFTIAGGPLPTKQNYRAMISLPVIGHSLRARISAESACKDNVLDKSFLQLGANQDMSPVGKNIDKETSVTSKPDLIKENSLIVPQTVAEVAVVDENLAENGTVRAFDSTVGDDRPHVGVASRNAETSETNGEMLAEADNCEQGSYQSNCQDDRGLVPIVQPVKHKSASCSISEYQKLPSFDKAMEFDPIKQHRHFCPWIVSGGNSFPGWQQTLSALQGHSLCNNVTSSSLIQVDDPVASVKKLFTPRTAKRTKFASTS
ncbi:C3HC zinc finger-like [Forsythia ovata]|uniref:C3HC zinc finger-like n=1 Tax=Forsythia ovata TaxID=205694 RepID=A0ABD1PG28_9LAMI